jgi:uncharacterized protein
MRFNHANGHIVRFRGRTVLLHVPTTALFELDELGIAALDVLGDEDVGRSEFARRLGSRFTRAEVDEFLDRLESLDILQAPARLLAINPQRVKVEEYPLSTLVLNVNTGCNLGCTYCYKEDLAKPADGRRMDFATAARSVDLLLAQAAARERVSIVFFGGEPLTNINLIQGVVDYAETRGSEERKQVDFSLTTNATLLTEALVDYFNAHRFGISVSIDGPRAIHDRNRRSVGGRGTYNVVARKVRMLLDRYQARPVGARVTLTRGTTEVEAIHEHLREDLGFHEVGYAPVTAAEGAAYGLSPDEMNEVYATFERMGDVYRQEALQGRTTGFSNLNQLMSDLHEGRRKSLPCGAGVGLLAVDHSGGLNLCHRFTGSTLPRFGDVESGIDKARLGAFLEKAADREGTHCATCRIRNLCAGGCYHEAYTRYGDPHHRTYHYCNILRRWVDFGVSVYVDILAGNPGFFGRYIEPRGSLQ